MNHLKSLIPILTFFVVAGLFFKLLGPIPLSVNQISTQKASTFDVSGEGSATVPPDTAEITLGVTTRESTVASAQQKTNQVINDLTKALKQNGVDEKDIKTINYSVNPEYDYSQGSNRITGYNVNANLLVKLTDFNKLNQAIDSATSLEANQVGGVNFTLSDQARIKAEDQARVEAVKIAKAKAESLSKAAGIRLGKIVNVQESSQGGPFPIYRDFAAMETKASPAEPTQIQPGSTEVKLTVTLSYETL